MALPKGWKLTTIFGAGNHGWQEVWYLPDQQIDQAMMSLEATLLSRQSMLGTGTRLQAYKVTALDDPGVSWVKNYAMPNQQTGQAFTRDTPYNAMYVQCSDSGRKYRRQVWLRGVPDDVIAFTANTITPIPPTAIITLLKAYEKKIFDQGFCMRCVNKDPTVAIRRPITAITVPAPGRFYTFVCPGHGFISGDQVRIGGNKGLGLLQYQMGKTFKVNSIWVARVIDVNSFSIDLTADPATILVVNRFGYAVVRKPILVPAYKLEYQRFAKRDTGRPFFLPVGRQLKKP